MTIQPGANVYTQGFGSRPESVEVPHIDVRAPSSTDINYPVGKRWVYTGNAVYDLLGFTTSNGVTSATWVESAGGSGDVAQLTGDSGTALPTAGSIKIAGTANQITTAASGSTVTLSLAGPYTPATYTAHGVLLGEGTGSIVATAAGTTGQVLIGSTGADPAFGALGLNSGLTSHGVLVGENNSAIVAITAGSTGQLLAGSTGADPAFTGSPSVSGSLTAATTITATLGAITATNGNLVLGTAGNKIVSTSVASTTTAGANSFGTVTLSSGTATISTTAVTANSIIMLTRQSPGSTGAAALGELSIGTISAGVSFVINALTVASSAAVATTDVSVIGWMIIN